MVILDDCRTSRCHHWHPIPLRVTFSRDVDRGGPDRQFMSVGCDGKSGLKRTTMVFGPSRSSFCKLSHADTAVGYVQSKCVVLLSKTSLAATGQVNTARVLLHFRSFDWHSPQEERKSSLNTDDQENGRS